MPDPGRAPSRVQSWRAYVVVVVDHLVKPSRTLHVRASSAAVAAGAGAREGVRLAGVPINSARVTQVHVRVEPLV